MDIGIARILSILTSVFLPLSIISVVAGVIADIWKRKFYWSKFALAFLLVTIILLIIQIKLIYKITGDILK